ncbi:hypothetical protein BDN67DRAFT_1072042 [Paxillus ammoniavirescens]|nr:hypothetical protein BDN67DRAFT_1072042 [Paxillus ammoniavirescens]
MSDATPGHDNVSSPTTTAADSVVRGWITSGSKNAVTVFAVVSAGQAKPVEELENKLTGSEANSHDFETLKQQAAQIADEYVHLTVGYSEAIGQVATNVRLGVGQKFGSHAAPLSPNTCPKP